MSDTHLPALTFNVSGVTSMANVNVDQEWQQVKREHKVLGFSPTISIRSNGTIAISSDFVKKADIESCSRASLFLSADGLRLAIRFHNDKNDNNAYTLGKDGGGSGKYKNRLIVATALLKQSDAVQGLFVQSSEARRYEPIKVQDKWIINLVPSQR